MDTESLYRLYLEHPSIETDTRKLTPGQLFFALKGPHFNGNLFAAKSLEMGAAYAVIDEKAYLSGDRMILVDDVLRSLQDLARHHRDTFDIPFIAVTGSNGKTTTKELIRAVLATRYTTYATEGNLNNHIGIPLTLLKIHRNVAMAVIEMGANHQREIAGYCKIVNPTHGIITNVGKAHLEGFGGIEGVRKGKGELFDHLRANGGTAFACRDFDYFAEMTTGLKQVIWYGTGKQEHQAARIIRSHPFLELDSSFAGILQTHLVGDYNLYNVLGAVTIGEYFGVDRQKTADAIAAYTPNNARSQLVQRGSNTIILDAYNANPSSMQAAIENFAAAPEHSKVLMLGAMMELGPESPGEHQKLIELIEKYRWKAVVLVGGDFVNTSHRYQYFPNAETAGKWLAGQGFQDTSILIKGSRSMAMEKVLG